MHTILELLYLPKNVNFLLKYQPTFSKPLLYAKSWHLRNCYRSKSFRKEKGNPLRVGVPWGLRQAPCWQRWEPTGVGAHPASGQPHAGHHTAQRRGQKWVAISGKSPVAGIWSASWQSPPRVTGPWGQIPRGPIQTLMTVPQPSSWG